MNFKHGDKVVLEIRFCGDRLWSKVEGEIVKDEGHIYLKHRDPAFKGDLPSIREINCWYWLLLPRNEGIEWRYPEVEPHNLSLFKSDLTVLINRHNIESMADTPDFILAEMICRMIEAMGPSIKNTLDWHGCDSVCHPSPDRKTEKEN